MIFLKKVTFLFCLLFNLTFGYSQTIKDAKFYIVDTTSLSELTQNDKEILDSALTQYHSTKIDSIKLYWLDFIGNNLQHNIWQRYNEYLYQKCQVLIKSNNTLYLKKIYASSINNIGYAAEHSGNIKKGITYYYKALKLYEELKNNEGAAYCLNNLAVLYEGQDEQEQALAYHKKALQLRLELKIDEQIIQSLNNLGTHYNKQEKHKEAIKYYHQALDIAIKTNDNNHQALIYGNIGNAYLHNSEKNNGAEYFEKSIEKYRELEDKWGISWGLFNLANTYVRKKDYNKAIELFQQSIKIGFEEKNTTLISNNYKLLYKTYEKNKNWENAFIFYERYIELRDSLKNSETQSLVIKKQAQYEYEKKKIFDDAENEKKLAIEKESKAKQRVILIATLIGLIFVAFFLLFVFNRLQITKKQKKVIENQKHIVEKAHHELAEKNKEILDSIAYAKRIQEAILPSRYSLTENLKNGFVLYKPKDIVAGDFYWLEKHGDSIFFAAADCTGHGVPGAMVSVVCSNALSKSLLEENITETGKLLDRTRELIVERFSKSGENVKDGMDISLCRLTNDELQWSGANNPLWIFSKNEEGKTELIEIKPDKQPIGLYDQPKPFTTHHIKLKKGDSIYIFTDGYQDQFGGEKGKKFKAVQLKNEISSILDKDMDTQKEILNEKFESWRGDQEQTDDVCIIGVQY